VDHASSYVHVEHQFGFSAVEKFEQDKPMNVNAWTMEYLFKTT
jgi:hypothetical protein